MQVFSNVVPLNLQRNGMSITKDKMLKTDSERKESIAPNNLVHRGLRPKQQATTNEVTGNTVKPELWKLVESGLLKPDYGVLTVHTPEKLFFASIDETGRIITDSGKSYSSLRQWCHSIPNFSRNCQKLGKSECSERVYYQGRSLSHLMLACEGLIDPDTSRDMGKISSRNGGSTGPEGGDPLPVALNLSEMKLLLIGNNEVERAIPEIDLWADVDRW